MRVKSPYVFLSHSSKDNDVTRIVADRLTEHQLSVWVDLDMLKTGDRWVREIQEGLDQAHALLVIMSRVARESEWVERETLWALQRRIPLFIAMIDDVPLPLHLITRQYTDCQHDLEAGIDSMVVTLREALQSDMRRPDEPVLPEGVSPDANEKNFFVYLRQTVDGAETALKARDLYMWARQAVDEVSFGSGRHTPAYHARLQLGEDTITLFSLYAYLRRPAVQIPLDQLMNYAPFNDSRVRLALLERLSAILPGQSEFAPDRADRRPSLGLATAFTTAEELEQFKQIMQDMIDALRSG